MVCYFFSFDFFCHHSADKSGRSRIFHQFFSQSSGSFPNISQPLGLQMISLPLQFDRGLIRTAIYETEDPNGDKTLLLHGSLLHLLHRHLQILPNLWPICRQCSLFGRIVEFRLMPVFSIFLLHLSTSSA